LCDGEVGAQITLHRFQLSIAGQKIEGGAVVQDEAQRILNVVNFTGGRKRLPEAAKQSVPSASRASAVQDIEEAGCTASSVENLELSKRLRINEHGLAPRWRAASTRVRLPEFPVPSARAQRRW
jgi:hypothetical protein